MHSCGAKNESNKKLQNLLLYGSGNSTTKSEFTENPLSTCAFR